MHLKKEQLSRFRKKLMEQRQTLLNRMVSTADLEIKQDDLADENDHAAAMVQQAVALNQKEKDRWLLKEIDHALSKMEDGSYGICEDTEEPIDADRLDAQPWTRYSVEAAEAREVRAKRFSRAG